MKNGAFMLVSNIFLHKQSNHQPNHARSRLSVMAGWLLVSFLASFFAISLSACDTDSANQTSDSSAANQVDGVATPSKDNAALSGKPLDILYVSERQYDDAPALAVIVSQQLDPTQRYDDLLTVVYGDEHAKAGEAVSGSWVLGDDKMTLYFPYVQPETSYSVMIQPELVAPGGKPLNKHVVESVETRTLTPVVAFASQGLILPRELSAGLPITAVNTAGVNVDYFRVPMDNLEAALAFDFSRGSSTYIEDIKELTEKHTELAYTGFYEIPAKPNQRVTVNLPVYDVPELQEPGMYIAVLRQPGFYDYQLKTAYFFISDIGLHIRDYHDTAEVHASSLATGEPVAGVKVSAWVAGEKPTELGDTNADGRLSLTAEQYNAYDDAFLLVGQQGNDVSAVPSNRAGLDLSEFDLGDRAYKPTEYFLYSPRDIYRPGEQVTIAGLKRDHDGFNSASVPLKLEAITADGKSAFTRTVRPNDLNYFDVTFPLATDAATGTWKLNVVSPVKNQGPLATYEFKVEDFLPERLKLDLSLMQPVIEPADTVSVEVEGAYLYGAPAAGNELGVKYLVKPLRQAAAALPGFYIGDVDERIRHTKELDKTKLDKAGQNIVQIDSNWQNIKSPAQVQMLFELFESGGRPVVRSIKQPVWPLAELPTVRPLFKGDEVDSFTGAEFEVGVANQAGELLAASDLQVEVIREDRSYYWTFTPGSGWSYEYTEQEYPIFSDVMDVPVGKTAKISVPVYWGAYRVEVRRQDVPQDEQLLTSYRFHAGWNWGGAETQRTARPDKVGLSLDKPHYQPGEVAQLTITPPHAGSALVLVEADKMLWQTRVDIPETGLVLDIPVDASWNRHDIHISAVVFRPGDKEDAITPNRALGLLHLPLDRSQRQLDVTLQAPDKMQPQSTLTTGIKIPNAAGKQAQVTLAAVDVGVLNLTSFQTPDPFAHFFGRRRFGVSLKDLYSLVIESKDGDMAKLRFGGDADLAAGGDMIKSEVQIVAMYSGTVTLDVNGDASIDFAIPDFNGRVRLMAVAFTEDAFGSAEQDVTIAAPLVAEISTPRFMAAGDVSTFALDLHNLSGKDETIEVNLTGGDYLGVLDGSRQVSLKNTEKQVLKFQVKAAEAFGLSEINLQATSQDVGGQDIGGQDIQVNRSWKLAVRPAYPGVTHSWRAALQPGDQWQLDRSLLGDMMSETVRASVVVSDLPPMDMKAAFDGLLQYPYGCIEQTTSRLAPLLYAGAESRRHFSLTLSEAERQELIEKGISRVESFQKASGGFGYWGGDSDERQWLSVYATDHLLRAKAQGFAVSDKVLDKAVKRVDKILQQSRRGSDFNNSYYDDNDHAWFAQRAYAGLVLAGVRRADLSTLRALYNNHADKAVSPLPLVQLGVALQLMGGHREAKEAIDKALTMQNQRRRYAWYGDYGSTVRDLGLMVALLNEHGYEEEAFAKTVALADALQGKRWYSTQERYAIFMAGLSMANRQGKAWQVAVTTVAGDNEVVMQGRQRFGYRRDELDDGLTVEVTGNEPVYVSAKLSGYNLKPPAPRQEVIDIRRRYFDLQGAPIERLTRLKTGDLVLVELQIDAERRYRNLLVADLLPAGLELENQNLDNAVKIDDIRVDDQALRYWWQQEPATYSQYLDDRFMASMDISSYRTRRLYYLARAVTPGTYTVPPPYAEDMYFADQFGIGATPDKLTIE